ncbi:hypothetical protein A2272_00485 [Candidatus Peregrinibacteria bacterium RIFOXYA12_FULL_33_12]|nr:MAG: hypothetical protein A2272_00485 [Candidatus Peregrinibacteria bacterium RIFOXYA12_FULL_33_12]
MSVETQPANENKRIESATLALVKIIIDQVLDTREKLFKTENFDDSKRKVTFVVVPCGTDKSGNNPSTPYEEILNFLINFVKENTTKKIKIVLAPGNKFGGELPEHCVAKQYLETKLENPTSVEVICPNVESQKYLSTDDNALKLKDLNCDIGPIVLLAYLPQLPRAIYTFQDYFMIQGWIGFDIDSPVQKNQIAEKLAWYYTRQNVHNLYEFCACLVKDLDLKSLISFFGWLKSKTKF